MRALIVLTAVAAVIAQQPRLAGSWNVHAEAVQGEDADGSSWSRGEFRGRLDIDEQGGSITGSWTGPMGTAWPLTGKRDGPAFELLTAVQDITATVDGQPTTVSAQWRFRGTLAADRLSGTMAMVLEKARREVPQPFTAERAKPR